MDNTSTDIPAGTLIELTDEELAAFELDPHLINLMWHEPFFSAMLRNVTKTRTDDIPTAGVLAKDGSIEMWWNPRFVAALEAMRIRGLLKHEVYHLIFDHTTTRRKTPHLLWNYATDLAINSLIPVEELPEGGLRPAQPLKLTDEARAKMTPEQLARFQTISDKIESLPLEMSSEWYFGALQDDKDFMDALDPQKGEGGQPGQPGQPGEGEGGEPGDGPGIPGHGDMDSHEGWDENMSDAEKELVKGKVKQALKEAIQRCDSNGQWGSVGADMRGRLREMVSNEVDWKAILRNFIGRSQRANRTSTMKRLNRKYPYIHSGRKIGHTANVACYVDMSGSVDDDALALLYAELSQLGRRVTFTFIPFDSEVDEASQFVWKKGRRVEAQRFRCGGTNFDAVAKHANANRDKYDGYIVLTDGEASNPGPSRLRRAWVIVPGRKLLFPLPKGDTLIQMKAAAKKEAA